MDIIIFYIICIIIIFKYANFKLNINSLFLITFTLLLFSILELESFKSNRKFFEKNDDKTSKCPIKQIKFNLLNQEFCSDNGSIGKNNNTCTLSESVSHKYPVCKTYKCPDGFKLIQMTHGGFCKNLSTNKYCAISQKNTNYKNCNNLSMFYKLDNHKYEVNDNIILEKHIKVSLPECKIKCRDNKNCNFFTHENNVCKLYRNILSGDSIKKYPKKNIYFKKLTNYKEEENVEIKGNDLAQYLNTTIAECANKCENNSKCNGYSWNKEFDVGACMLKTSKKDKDKDYNNVYNSYSKNFNYNKLNDLDKQNTIDLEIDQKQIKTEEDCKLNCKSYFNNINNNKDNDNFFSNNEFYKYENTKCICKIPYKFVNNKDKLNGWLCKSTDKIVKETIDEIQVNSDENYNDKLYRLRYKNENKKMKLISNVKKKEIKKLYEILIKNGNYLFITNIAEKLLNNKINKIIIKKKNPNTMLTLANIEILNKSSIITDRIKSIEYSSKSDKSDIDTLYSNNKNLNILFTTQMQDNPHIIIHFAEKFEINELKIYGDVNNRFSIYPLRVEFYNDDNLIIYYDRLSKYSEIQKSKEIDNFKKLKNYNIKNWGHPDFYRSFCNVSGTQENNDYCKIVKNKLSNSYDLECNTYDNNNIYNLINIDIGHKNSQYMKDESGNGHDDFCRCVGDFPQSKVKCFQATKEGFNKEFYPINKPTNCYGYNSNQLKNYMDVKKKKLCNKEDKYFVSAGFYYHVNKYYYLFKNTQLNNKKVVLVSLLSKNKNNSVKNGYPKLFDENEWPNLPYIYYKYLDAVLYIGNNSVILFSNQYCIFYNIMEQYPYYINYVTGEYIFEIDRNRFINEVFTNLNLNKVDAVDITDITIKSDTDRLNRFLRILKNDYDLKNKDIIKNLQKYYIFNWNELHDKESVATSILIKITNLIQLCNQFNKDIKYFYSKIYYIFNNYYIPKCFIFSGNKYYEFIQPINNSESIIKEMDINSKNINGYTYAKVDAFVTFYDTLQMSTLLYKGNNVIFYSLNSKNNKSVFNKIKNIHKNLWKIKTNNLINKNKNIYYFKLNKNITEIKSNYNIELKIEYKNKLEIYKNNILIDINAKYNELENINNIGKIVENKKNSRLLKFYLIVNDGISEKTYTKEILDSEIINNFKISPYIFNIIFHNKYIITLHKINI